MDENRSGCFLAAPIFGALLFFAAFPLLFWNEGRAVKTYQVLLEGESIVMTVNPSEVSPSNDGKLIHLNGYAETAQTIRDDVFGIAAENMLRLRREVEMYQWDEDSETTGEGDNKKTEYSYRKVWSDNPINSSSFNVQDGHQNPDMPYRDQTLNASEVTVGGFTLPSSMVDEISDFEDLPLNSTPQMNEIKLVQNSYYYIGRDEASPEIGDVKVEFSVVKPQNVSVVAQQSGNTFAPYPTSYTPIEMFKTGTHSSSDMFAEAQSENTMLMWFLRVVGFGLMFGGIMMIFKPLTNLLDYIPLLGDIANFGISVFAFVIAFSGSFITIAIGWIFYRPLLAGGLLAIAFAVLGGAWYLAQQKKEASASA